MGFFPTGSPKSLNPAGHGNGADEGGYSSPRGTSKQWIRTRPTRILGP